MARNLFEIILPLCLKCMPFENHRTVLWCTVSKRTRPEEVEFRNERARGTRKAFVECWRVVARYHRRRTVRGSDAFIMESIIANCVNFVVISRTYIQGGRRLRRRNSSTCTQVALSTIIHWYLGRYKIHTLDSKHKDGTH